MHQPFTREIMSQEEAAEFYRQYAPQVATYLRLHMRSKEDAEDLLVDIFLACLESSAFQCLPDPQQRAWLWRVVHNKMADFYRKGVVRQYVVNVDDHIKEIYYDEDLSPERMAERSEEYRLLSELVRTLPQAQWQVLQLRLVHGLPYKEIAGHLGKNETAIRAVFSRTLSFLRSAYHQKQGGKHDR